MYNSKLCFFIFQRSIDFSSLSYFPNDVREKKNKKNWVVSEKIEPFQTFEIYLFIY